MRWTLLEVLIALALAACAVLAGLAGVEAALVASAERGGEVLRSAAEVRAIAGRGLALFAVGGVALAAARVWAAWRGGAHALAVPWLVPALVGALALGIAVQMGYGDPLRGPSWPGATFASGAGLGLLVAAAVVAWPWDPGTAVERLQLPLLLVSAAILAALWSAGDGPAGSGTRINLLGAQPIEVVKLLLVAFLAGFFGPRAARLRWERGPLGLPRPTLLVPAVLALAGTFAALVFVRDLGPTLILAAVFTAMVYAVTRSPAWLAAAGGVVGLGVAVVARWPELVGGSLATRVAMWTRPWLNGLPGGDQLASARWAIAAGGWFGRGVGQAHPGALPAGHTDLALAHLAEELGAAGVALYLLCLAAIALGALRIAAGNRTPTRALLALGLGALLVAQWAVIFAGTVGLAPLTGVVVPLLSAGRSSMIATCAGIGLVLRLASDGRPVARQGSVDELAVVARRAQWAVVGLFGAAASLVGWLAGPLGPSTSARPVVTTLADGTVRVQHDRRLLAIADAIGRGELRDRHGEALVGPGTGPGRSHPLGPDLGTLVGFDDPRLLRPPWALEGVHDVVLRGYPELEDGPATWMARVDGQPEVLVYAVPSRVERAGDRARAQRLAEGWLGPEVTVRLLPRPAPDLSALVSLLRDPAAVEARAADVDARSVALTLDGALQREVASVVREASAGGLAAAAVVIDVDSGEVLARAQAPDFDPGDPAARAARIAADPSFVGAYGPWPDLTGDRGVAQAGSIGKLLTALAAARSGDGVVGEGCEARSTRVLSCDHRDARGPAWSAEGWTRPIHDHRSDPIHGAIDVSRALAVSCNVYFGQLGVALGPEPLRSLVSDGVDVGWGGGFEPGAAGSRTLASTAFGQGAAALSVSQAARLVAAVAGGGVYRACPLELGAACEEAPLVDDPRAIQPILAGMRLAMTDGTGRGLPVIDGVRVYGKTGTADAIGLADEAPYGVRPGSTSEAPHSWFVAIAEPEHVLACGSEARGRLAVAVWVARGGSGRRAAAPAAIEIVRAARGLGYLAPPVELGAAPSTPVGAADG